MGCLIFCVLQYVALRCSSEDPWDASSLCVAVCCSIEDACDASKFNVVVICSVLQ